MGDKKRTPLEKGNALEQAVAAIEQVILGLEPTARDKKFTFDFKKIFVLQGVRHEVDIYVAVDFAQGYQGKFGFECKNWAKPVGKNEIMIFSGKIAALGLSHGYFVAPSFTEDAKAQAKLDNRLTLLTVTEHDPLLLTGFSSYVVRHRYQNFGVEMFRRDGQPLQLPSGDVQPQIRYQGTAANFEELLREWTRLHMLEKLRNFAADKPAGDYPFAVDFVREFPTGDLEMEGQDVDKIRIVADGIASIFHRPVVSSFEIKSRGRVVSFAPMEIPGINISASRTVFVGRDEKK
jgi:hypothetical protein